MAKDLICPDRLLRELYGQLTENPPLSIEDIVKLIKSQPRLPAVPAGADTVTVVRCKDCKYFTPQPDTIEACCDLTYSRALPNEYCSYGERREADESIKDET